MSEKQLTSTTAGPPAHAGRTANGATGHKARDAASAGAHDTRLQAQFAVSLQKVDKALDRADPVRMVHETRKAIKEYRALLRLVATPEADAARRLAAQTARALSSARDQQASRDAVDALVAHEALSEPDAEAVRAALADAPVESTAPVDHAQQVRDWLGAARSQHARILDQQAVDSDLRKGLRRAYEKARDAGHFRDAEDMHELRKRVVTHRYQMSFVAEISGGGGAKRAKRAQTLRDHLGLMQDIETLGQSLTQSALSSQLRARVETAAGQVQRTLTTQARDLHRSLFNRPAKAFGHKVTRLIGRPA